jgi:hypothetical protein
MSPVPLLISSALTKEKGNPGANVKLLIPVQDETTAREFLAGGRKKVGSGMTAWTCVPVQLDENLPAVDDTMYLSLGNRKDGNPLNHRRSCAPREKLAWSGETGGTLGIHVWKFWATAEGTHVRTEESWEGPSPPALVKEIQEALDASLIRWLSSLKARAEPAVV